MKYLRNKLIEFIPLFNINFKIKKNIISCSLFKRDNENYYKNFDEYIDGLIKLSYKAIHIKFSLRLFIDNSIYYDYNIMKILRKINKIEIILFECDLYKIKQKEDEINNTGQYTFNQKVTDYLLGTKKSNGTHQGLFGTLVRFFPMFNFPNNDANIVIIFDIDNYAFNKYIEIFQILDKKINREIENLYLIKMSNAGRMFKNKELYNHNYKGVILDYIRPDEIICMKQIDFNVIINFLVNLDSNIVYSYYKNENYFSQSHKSLLDKKSYDSKFSENNGFFIYGIDEYFINNEYMHYFIDNKKPFLNIVKFNINSIYYYQINIRNEPWLNTNKIIFNELLDNILEKCNIKTYKTYKLNENQITDKLLFKKFNNIEKHKNYIKILYETFLEIMNKKKYSFMINSIYNDLLTTPKYINLYLFKEFQFNFIEIKNFFTIKNKLEFQKTQRNLKKNKFEFKKTIKKRR